MAWACMAASGVGSLILIDVTHGGSSRINSEVYINILPNLRINSSKLIGRNAFQILKKRLKGKNSTERGCSKRLEKHPKRKE